MATSRLPEIWLRVVVNGTPNGGKRMCRWPGLISAVLLILSTVTAASAWEDDFHYGMTRWLALQAGFGSERAQTIAIANLEADVGLEDARYLVFFYACIPFRDPKASELVRDLHFPTFETVPNPPRRRAVEAGSRAAQQQALKEILFPPAPNASPQEQLNRLAWIGRALHPLQDSWSHQGVPDFPPVICDGNLAWGHPEARGGWNNHAADHTHRWVDAAVRAAKRTYELLVEYLQKHGWAREKASKDWSALENDVVAFARADTKTAKRDWFKARGFGDFTFLASITLPDGREPFSLAGLLQRGPRGVLPPAFGTVKVPLDLEGVVKALVESWVLQPDLNDLVRRFVDSEAVAKELRVPPDWFPDRRTPTAAAFGMWRVRDHGLVTALGHAIVRDVPGGSSKENFQRLVTLVSDPKARLYFKSINDALLAFGKDAALPFLVLPADEAGRQYAAMVRFKTAPHDVVRVGMQRVGDRWRAVSLSWTLDH